MSSVCDIYRVQCYFLLLLSIDFNPFLKTINNKNNTKKDWGVSYHTIWALYCISCFHHSLYSAFF